MSRPVALLGVLLLLLGAGCTTRTELRTLETTTPGAPSASTAAAEHNLADVTYAVDVVRLHEQALRMVAMAAGKDVSPEVARLARDIGESRFDELGDLARLMGRWDVEPHGSDGRRTRGELTWRQLDALERLDGPAFEERWLAVMGANHRSAVAMSRAEIHDGRSLGARGLAQRLLETQGAQLDALERLAGR